MDNFDDFTPPKSASKLASIFNRNSPIDNTSLLYTAPKQPKKDDSPQKSHEAGPTKLEIIIAKTVFAYKLQNGTYQAAGKTGLTLLGCKSPSVYQLLLYKTREDVLCKIHVGPNFTFTVSDKNYASFYSETQQNYSVMFDSDEELKEFAVKVAIAKAKLSNSVIVQDLKYGNGEIITTDGTISMASVLYFELSDSNDCHNKKIAAEDLKVANLKNYSWGKDIVGLRENSEKVVIIPRDQSQPYKEKLEASSRLMIFIVIKESIKSNSEENSDILGVSFESSEETKSCKEKGEVLEGALAAKSHKSDLLSRVARLGQPTLPLKGALVADFSDSDGDSSSSPKPRIRSKPPATSFRTPQVHPDPRQSNMQPIAQPLALYQPPVQPQIIMRNDPASFGPMYTPIANISSPNDGALTAYFSESRTQAAELRMGINQMANKLDLLMNKVQDLQISSVSNNQNQQAMMPQTTDPLALLANVQALVQENQSMKAKIEEQKSKIDTQNERIFQLLELSQKSLEEKSVSLKSQGNEEKLLTEISKLKNEICALEACNEKLNAELINYKHENEVLNVKCDAKEKELEEVRDECDSKLRALESRSEESVNACDSVKKGLELEVNRLQDELDTQRKMVGEKSLALDEEKEKINELKIQNSTLKMEISKLETNLKISSESMEPQLGPQQNVADTKSLMNEVYRNLHTQFSADTNYLGIQIKQVLADVIRTMTLQFLEKHSINEQKVNKEISDPKDQSAIDENHEEDSFHPEKETKNHVASPDVSSYSAGTTSLPDDSHSSSPIGNINGGAQSFTEPPEKQVSSTLAQPWDFTEPPPLPDFDERDDDDADWS